MKRDIQTIIDGYNAAYRRLHPEMEWTREDIIRAQKRQKDAAYQAIYRTIDECKRCINAERIKSFNPDQPRDEDGRWTSGGGSSNSNINDSNLGPGTQYADSG